MPDAKQNIEELAFALKLGHRRISIESDGLYKVGLGIELELVATQRVLSAPPRAHHRYTVSNSLLATDSLGTFMRQQVQQVEGHRVHGTGGDARRVPVSP